MGLATFWANFSQTHLVTLQVAKDDLGRSQNRAKNLFHFDLKDYRSHLFDLMTAKTGSA
jgi:hypothetical protein